MSVIRMVFLKEFQDIVRNRRRFYWMMFSSFILFPLLFAGPYGLLFARVTEQSIETLTVPVQGMEYAPALMAYLAEEENIEAVPVENVEAVVLAKEYYVGLVIPSEYESRLAAGQSVEILLINDGRRSMDITSSRLISALDAYREALVTERLQSLGMTEEFLEPFVIERKNAASTTETTGSQLGLLIPGFIISIGLSAGMPIAISSIAGEKKNLTLEPVLFTTVSRFQLILAKLLAVLASIVLNMLGSLLSSLFAGVVFFVLVFRSLMDEFSTAASASAAEASGLDPLAVIKEYSIEPLAILLFLAAPALIILFGSLLQLVISTWARNDEEANTYMMPLNFMSIAVFFVALFLDEYIPQLWHYAVPVFGVIISMRDLLSNRMDAPSLLVMFLSSFIYAALMLGVATWMFHREEVVFRT